MSGWIKLEKDRRDDPRVIRMARSLRDAGVTHERFTSAMHVTLVLGCLDVLWCYADTHVREDDTLDLGADEIDELVGLQGFCNLMPPDWLEVLDAKSVKLPDFHAHNGTESKRRALTQKRTERYRNAEALRDVTQSSRISVTRASPDLDQTKTIPDQKDGEDGSRAARPPSATRIPDEFLLTDERRAYAQSEGVDPDRTFAKFRDHWAAKSGANARKVDWDATWRNWCRNETDRNGNGANHRSSKPRPSAVERVYAATAHLVGDEGRVGVAVDGGVVRASVPERLRRES